MNSIKSVNSANNVNSVKSVNSVNSVKSVNSFNSVSSAVKRGATSISDGIFDDDIGGAVGVGCHVTFLYFDSGCGLDGDGVDSA